ncbi:MAG: hypothetical protein COB59_07540 [Rhodospirillaceae bacterium]|nr:MAG: hypothetical protein COB59_07540 [Rhodospirillaceae bacterium]
METPDIEFQDEANTLNFQSASDKFYNVLQNDLPEFTQLFTNPEKQHMMFYAALRSIDGLKDNKTKLAVYLRSIGVKHKMLGLTHYHMEIGRNAFEQAIFAGGKDLTHDQRQFYIDSFSQIEKNMGF